MYSGDEEMLEGVIRVGADEWEIPVGYVPGMRVPGRFFLSDALAAILEPGAVQQLANVATLPGIVRYSLGMPDIHWGYGFPIGGVAAFSLEEGVISPGGVGFDINCGVRLFMTPLVRTDIKKPREFLESLYHAVPTGVGAKSSAKLTPLRFGHDGEGGGWAVDAGYGLERDLVRCEEGGAMKQADIRAVSAKARARGSLRGGTLGSGNHFLELQEVSEIYDEAAAAAFGLVKGRVCCMIHCGSRGLGHQVCTDHLKVIEEATKKYHIPLPDRQLACAPFGHRKGPPILARWQQRRIMHGPTAR